eukprot:6196932-Pleurochrysis_carterae.AAC.2
MRAAFTRSGGRVRAIEASLEGRRLAANAPLRVVEVDLVRGARARVGSKELHGRQLVGEHLAAEADRLGGHAVQVIRVHVEGPAEPLDRPA